MDDMQQRSEGFIKYTDLLEEGTICDCTANSRCMIKVL